MESKEEGSFHLQERKLEAPLSGKMEATSLQRKEVFGGQEIDELPILGTRKEGTVIRYGRKKTKQTRKDNWISS